MLSSPTDRGSSRLLPRTVSSLGPRKNHGHVIRLFSSADPILDRAGDRIANAGERLVAMFLDQLDQAVLAEFAGFVLRFGDAVGECGEDIARLHRDRGFAIGRTIKQ